MSRPTTGKEANRPTAYRSPNLRVPSVKVAALIFLLAMPSARAVRKHRFRALRAGDCCSFPMRESLPIGPVSPDIASWTADGAPW